MVGKPRILVAFLLILCVAGVNAFQYSVRVVKNIRGNLSETVTLKRISSLESNVCSGHQDARWSRCEEAVQIPHCTLENTTLDKSRKAGEAKVYTIKESGLAEDSIIACECPATPKSIYLTDNKELPGDHVHVIFVQRITFTKRVLWKGPRKVAGRVRKAIAGKTESSSVEGPVPNTGHEQNRSDDERRENSEDRVSVRGGGSARGNRSESGSVVDGRPTEQRSTVPRNREHSVKDKNDSSDSLSVTSRISARDRPASKGKKTERRGRQSDQSLKKASGGDDLSLPDPSDSASFFEGPASANNEVYKDIQRTKRPESLLDEDRKLESIPPSTRGENTRPRSVRAPSVQSESSHGREAASAAHRNKQLPYNRRTSRNGSVREEPVAGSRSEGMMSKVLSVSDRRQSKKESLQEIPPKNLSISGESSGGRTRERAQKTRTPSETALRRSESQRAVRGSTEDRSLGGNIRERAVPSNLGHTPSTRRQSGRTNLDDRQSNLSKSSSVNRTVPQRTPPESPEHNDSSSRRKARDQPLRSGSDRESNRSFRGAPVRMTDEGSGSRSTGEINEERRLQRNASVSARGSRTSDVRSLAPHHSRDKARQKSNVENTSGSSSIIRRGRTRPSAEDVSD